MGDVGRGEGWSEGAEDVCASRGGYSISPQACCWDPESPGPTWTVSLSGGPGFWCVLPCLPTAACHGPVSENWLPTPILPSVFGGRLVGWQETRGCPEPPSLAVPRLPPSQGFGLSRGEGALSTAKIGGLGHGQGTNPSCRLLSWDPAHVHSQSRGFVESRSFVSSAFPLGSGKGAGLGVCLRDLGECLCDLGMCQHGTRQIRCLAGMKLPCVTRWWGKKPGQTPVSLLPSGSCKNKVARSSRGSMEPTGLQRCRKNMKEFACELELDKSPPPSPLSTHGRRVHLCLFTCCHQEFTGIKAGGGSRPVVSSFWTHRQPLIQKSVIP